MIAVPVLALRLVALATIDERSRKSLRHLLGEDTVVAISHIRDNIQVGQAEAQPEEMMMAKHRVFFGTEVERVRLINISLAGTTSCPTAGTV